MMIAVTKSYEGFEADLNWAEVDEERIMRLPLIRGFEDFGPKEAVPELSRVSRTANSWQAIRAYRKSMLREIEELNELIAKSYDLEQGYPSGEDERWVRRRGVTREQFDQLVELIRLDTGLVNLDPRPFARCGEL